MDRYFPVIKIRGTAEDLGRQHGTLLKERIHRTIEFYQNQFQLPEQQILGIAAQFRKSTEVFREDIFIEIEALARAAEVDPLWIYALNGRTELLNLNPMECTALVFRKQRLIGQNWDWHGEMEELAIILDIEKENGHRILTMTEPGMVGKIGMNHCGVGVCLNFMTIENYQPSGVPLHVLLRSILDSKSVYEAQTLIQPHLCGKVGNILISNGTGDIVDLELAGDEFFSIPVDDLFVHTNHFLTKVDYDLKLFPSSTGRYNRAKKLLSQLEDPSIDSIKNILKDRENGDTPICRTHFSHPWLTDDMSITVTTIIMDLKNLKFHITRGNPVDNPFTVFSLKN
ncbi:MAG: C45 family peptidase [Candidatus Aminicenantes bacterium]|nr:C45 family peptidase [Candidatus Aminicenantes bacterium]